MNLDTTSRKATSPNGTVIADYRIAVFHRFTDDQMERTLETKIKAETLAMAQLYAGHAAVGLANMGADILGVSVHRADVEEWSDAS